MRQSQNCELRNRRKVETQLSQASPAMSSDDSDEYFSDRSEKRSKAKRGRASGGSAKQRGSGNAGRSLGASLNLGNGAGSGLTGPGGSKLKLKVKAGAPAAQGKRNARGAFVIANGKEANIPPQWQGYGDRELDSDTEEPLVFEEAFMLRMPVPTNAEQERELQRFADMVQKREQMDEKDVWFKFMDSRRAVFNLGQTMYNAKLVDLPCIVESQKTHDNKHFFKTADISQVSQICLGKRNWLTSVPADAAGRASSSQ